MRTLAILNPIAGSGRSRYVWERARGASDLKASECVTTERRLHAGELAREAASSGYQRVVVVGGDGTVSEVANALVHTDTEVAIIPVGTGNDTARNLGVPREPLAAARLAASGSARSVDIGRIETARTNAYFLNIAGFGFDAEVAWRVNRIPRLVGGTLPYVAAVIQTLLTYRSPRVRVTLDAEHHEACMFMTAVANMSSYGGGMRIAPAAIPDDGMFDVCMVRDVSRLEVLRLVPRMYSGGHVGHPAVTLLSAQALTAESDERVRCHADGELVGDLPARFSLIPRGLRCVTGV